MNNIFIPLLNKSKISAVQSIDTNGNVLPEGLALLIFSLSHRAQVSIILKPQVDKGKIPQLESVKWSAKTIANNPKIRELTCLLAIADNISYSAQSIPDVTAEKLKTLALAEWEALKSEKPPAGCRLLPPSAINSENIRRQQHATVAQYIGKWQNIAIHNPLSLIKNIPIAPLDVNGLHVLFLTLTNNLEIIVPPDLSTFEGFKNFIKDNLFNEDLTFIDEVNIGTKDNKIPLENFFQVSRISPINIPATTVPDTDKDDPLIKLILTQNPLNNNKQRTQNKKSTTKPNSKQRNNNNDNKENNNENPKRRRR